MCVCVHTCARFSVCCFCSWSLCCAFFVASVHNILVEVSCVPLLVPLLCECACVCVCVRERERETQRERFLFTSTVSLELVLRRPFLCQKYAGLFKLSQSCYFCRARVFVVSFFVSSLFNRLFRVSLSYVSIHQSVTKITREMERERERDFDWLVELGICNDEHWAWKRSGVGSGGFKLYKNGTGYMHIFNRWTL